MFLKVRTTKPVSIPLYESHLLSQPHKPCTFNSLAYPHRIAPVSDIMVCLHSLGKPCTPLSTVCHPRAGLVIVAIAVPLVIIVVSVCIIAVSVILYKASKKRKRRVPPTHVMANNPIVEYPSSTTTLPDIGETSMESLNNIELSPVKPLNSQSSPIRGVSPDSPSVVVLYSPKTPNVEIRDILGTLVVGLCQYGINAKSPDTCVSDSISAWLESEMENSIVLLVCNEALKSDWECERPSKLVCSLRQLLHGSLVDRGLSKFATVFMGKDAESGYVPSAYLMPQNQFTVRDINDVIDISHFVFKIPRYEARCDV